MREARLTHRRWAGGPGTRGNESTYETWVPQSRGPHRQVFVRGVEVPHRRCLQIITLPWRTMKISTPERSARCRRERGIYAGQVAFRQGDSASGKNEGVSISELRAFIGNL